MNNGQVYFTRRDVCVHSGDFLCELTNKPHKCIACKEFVSAATKYDCEYYDCINKECRILTNNSSQGGGYGGAPCAQPRRKKDGFAVECTFYKKK